MKKSSFLMVCIAVMSQISSISYGAETAAGKITEVSRKIIERAEIKGSDEELRMMLVEFPPAFSNAIHTHPADGLCYVIEGEAESQYEGDTVKVFRTGDSFQDMANRKHLLFRNVSQTDGLRFICTTKMKKDQPYMQPTKN
jgi:quercetin dioxygenase-like cupin family protein